MTEANGIPKPTQGKVSMVMPCYNKEAYISVTFDTILNQTWDNIEMVLVNDGSTDRTGEIIADYGQKFKERGYEVIFVDQENGGVIAAAKAGLERITGDYVCLVDADDELDPEYVSTLAGWLDEHPECDIAICSAVNFGNTPDGIKRWNLPPKRVPENDNMIGIEHFLLGEIIRNTVWVHMVRRTHLESRKVVQNYYTDSRGSHEPGYVIPILSGESNKKFFPIALYNFNASGDGHSQFKSMQHTRAFYDEYDRLCVIAIDALADDIANQAEKKFYKNVSMLSKFIHLYRVAVVLKVDVSVLDDCSAELRGAVNLAYMIDPPIDAKRVKGREVLLYQAVEANIFSRQTAEQKDAFPELQIERLYG